MAAARSFCFRKMECGQKRLERGGERLEKGCGRESLFWPDSCAKPQKKHFWFGPVCTQSFLGVRVYFSTGGVARFLQPIRSWCNGGSLDDAPLWCERQVKCRYLGPPSELSVSFSPRSSSAVSSHDRVLVLAEGCCMRWWWSCGLVRPDGGSTR